MFFLFYKFLFFLSDFLEIQRKSFFLFLSFQLGEEFSKFKFQPPQKSTSKLKNPLKNTALNFQPAPSVPASAAFSPSSARFSGEPTRSPKRGAAGVRPGHQSLRMKKKSNKNKVNVSLSFIYDKYKFLKPISNIEESILLSKTYCCHFYLPIQLIDHSINFTEIQWIFLGTLPLLTRRGHFIINGSPRIILNQIIRSPGIYFHKEQVSKSSRLFYAEIISKRGPWIRLEIDPKKKVWVSQSRFPRISLSCFFQTFYKKYLDHHLFLSEKKKFNFKNFWLNEFWPKKQLTERKKTPKTLKKLHKPVTLQKLYKKTVVINHLESKNTTNRFKTYHIKPRFYQQSHMYNQKSWKETPPPTSLCSNIFFASSAKTSDLSFNLGQKGRLRLNDKLGLSFKMSTLNPIDFLAISDILFQLTTNLTTDPTLSKTLDDIDDLKNRKIKTVGELLQDQLARGIQRLQKTFENNFRKFGYSSNASFSLLKSLRRRRKKRKEARFSGESSQAWKSPMGKRSMVGSPASPLARRASDEASPKVSRSVSQNRKYLEKTKKVESHFKRNFMWTEIGLKFWNFGKKNKFINKGNVSIFSILNNQPINSTFKEFFHSHQLSQYLDQSNPLAEITHKRRLSCLGSGGISRDTAGMEIRVIHITHYGRICPIETPEGKNAGLVNSLTTAGIVNRKGYLETPFVEVYKQHLQNQKKMVFFSVENQETKNIFFSQKFPKIKNVFVGIIKLQTKNFQKSAINKIHLISQNPQHFFSIATTCIPFVEHDDANRALMGSNMQRQAFPLITLEQPIVTTLNSWRVLSDLKDIPISSHRGIIMYASQQKISICETLLYNYNSKKKIQKKYNVSGKRKVFKKKQKLQRQCFLSKAEPFTPKAPQAPQQTHLRCLRCLRLCSSRPKASHFSALLRK